VLGSIRDVLSKQLPFEYLRPVIFANLSRSRNSRNKGRANILGFTVSVLYFLSAMFVVKISCTGNLNIALNFRCKELVQLSYNTSFLCKICEFGLCHLYKETGMDLCRECIFHLTSAEECQSDL